MDRAKFDTTAPETISQASDEDRRANHRKNFKGGKRHPSGRSGKGKVTERKSRHSRRA